MATKQKLRKNKDGLHNPRKLLKDSGLSFEQMVFVALSWFGFTNAEAWGVVNPLSDASANSRAVMAGRWACDPLVKGSINLLNALQAEKRLTFKGFKGYYNPDDDDDYYYDYYDYDNDIWLRKRK